MRKWCWRLLLTLMIVATFTYGAIRIWFYRTDGFRLEHISSAFEPDPKWETRKLTEWESEQLDHALSQSFFYFGKGCQSYCFESEDGKYILKFLKYKRYRPQFYFYWFTFLPMYEKYLESKIQYKNRQLHSLWKSWMLAFNELSNETALVYVHLNKTDHLNKTVTIHDKTGNSYELDMDQMEFLIQKKGDLVCTGINRLMDEGRVQDAQKVLTSLFQMIISEYHRGIADTDHALMQNTGVIGEKPFQLDVGRFEYDPFMRNPDFYHQELFNKYYKFRLWLKERHPSLLDHVDRELEDEMGDRLYTITYIPSN